MAAVTIGPDRAAAQRAAAAMAAGGLGPRGAVAVRTRHQSPYATKSTPVM